MFITLEGGEGCGKSTQIRLLADRLRSDGYSLIVTREPGGTPIGDSVRKILLDPSNIGLTPKSEFFLFMAGRAQHCSEVIAPALEKGMVVISDRFLDSTKVYQCYTRECISESFMDACNEEAIATPSHRCMPDLTLVLDVDVIRGNKRAQARNSQSNDISEARIDNESIIFHTKVNEGFRRLGSSGGRYVLVDANRSIEEIHWSIYKEVMNRLAEEALSE